MSTSAGNKSVGSNSGSRRKARLTRAGNNIDSFPFDKLSVDGADLAKSIISPLADPTFAMMRARDPLDLDSTSSTYESSDEESPPFRKQLKSIDENNSSENAGQSQMSLASSGLSQSTKHAFQSAMKSLPSTSFSGSDPTAESVTTPSKPPKMPEGVSPAKSTQSLSYSQSNPSSGSNPPRVSSPSVISKTSGALSVDPEAKHSSRIVRKTRSYDSQTEGSRVTEEDTYYDTYDSPRASDMYVGRLNDAASPEESRDFSKLQLSLSPNDRPFVADSTYTFQSVSSVGSRRNEADVSVHLSPNCEHSSKQHRNEQGVPVQQYSTDNRAADPPMEPDGDIGDTSSYHGESLVPTPNDLDGNQSFDYSQEAASSGPYSRRTNESEEEYSGSDSDSYEEETSSEYEEDEKDTENPDPSSSSTSKPPVERSSPFPSYRLLTFMIVTIILVVGGLIGGLTYYLWDKKKIDPIRPPTPVAPKPTVPGIVVPPSEFDDLGPLIPSDAELYDIFESVVGEGAKLSFTTAGKAADWMIKEDPGKALKIRSRDAWIQRYLLVHTYFSTTLNRSTSWLSCNPPTDSSSDECEYTYPTEIPGGRIIYDLVPSHAWLSAADECHWGGVACGVTVTDEVVAAKADVPDQKGVFNLPVTTTMSRSAVTSIILAGQYLKGTVVTELTALPMLEHLDLSHNGMKGALSDKFRSLKTLRLQYNAMEGTIPSNFFDDQSAMSVLNIGANAMSGSIPSEVGLASKINSLYLFDNKFTGRIPVLGNMPLVNFQAQENQFTGQLPFDYSYGGTWADTLREWWVYDNNLTGSLSDSLSFLTSLEDIRINDNNLSGRIPESIIDLQRLFRFDAQSNALTGTVPEGIGNLPVLRDVRLQFNNLDGVVPTSLCFLESMEVLEADCLEPYWSADPKTDCYCCTTCCNPDRNECKYY